MVLIEKFNGCVYTVSEHQYDTPSGEERRFLYFNHLSKEFLEQMIPRVLVKVVLFQFRGRGHSQDDATPNFFADSKRPI